jgi:hypothetical protein
MVIYAKIGTGPQKVIWVYKKRNLPKVGEVIQFMPYPRPSGEKWRKGKVEEIKHLGYLLFYISLW